MKQSQETERAFSRPSFLPLDWFFNRSRRSYYLFLNYLFLLLVWGIAFTDKFPPWGDSFHRGKSLRITVTCGNFHEVAARSMPQERVSVIQGTERTRGAVRCDL